MSTSHRSHPPLQLHYAIRASALGPALLAATEQGMAAVLLGDDANALMDDLQRRYPQAQLRAAGAVLHRWGDTVLEIVAQPKLQHMVPLDVPAGTALQRQVWQALRSIPAGQTCSYTDLARMVGRPRSVRAVATACGANPLAVLVPCHRVLRSDGGLGGYRWGLQRKRQLLIQEGVLQ